MLSLLLVITGAATHLSGLPIKSTNDFLAKLVKPLSG